MINGFWTHFSFFSLLIAKSILLFFFFTYENVIFFATIYVVPWPNLIVFTCLNCFGSTFSSIFLEITFPYFSYANFSSYNIKFQSLFGHISSKSLRSLPTDVQLWKIILLENSICVIKKNVCFLFSWENIDFF